ncbi:MAG: DUF2207 domain-containing protein [Gemmatimonadota bacterium]
MTGRSKRSAVFSLLLALLFLAPVAARAQDTGWTITSFHSDYSVQPDRSIDVVERIAVDFGPLQRHGIYREIPVKYRKVIREGLPIEGRVEVDFDLEEVTDGQGNELQTQVDRGDRVRIRIGDPNRTITGRQTYVIHYRLGSGLGFFEEHDELYWQVTGTEWPVPILQASANVTLPPAEAWANRDAEDWSAWCYAGWFESTSGERCTAAVVDAGRYRFEAGRLEAGEGLTLVAAFPKGVIRAPTGAEKLAQAVATWWPAGLPFAAFFLMFGLWSTRGREPSAGSIVPVWRPPDGVPPGAAGTLVDQRADMDDVVATLLDLAVRGYVRIREVPPGGVMGMVEEGSFAGKALRSLGLYKTDWELECTGKASADGDLTHYEGRVLHGVFEGDSSRRMSDLHNEFYEHLPEIHDGMYDLLVRKGLFRRSPDTVRKIYRWAGIGGLVLGGVLVAQAENWILGAGVALGGVIVLVFSSFMPAMTLEGARRWREVKGLEEYIRRAEKAELEFSQAPEKTTELFETLLPYAVALDVSDLWVNQFADVLAASPPAWYAGTAYGGFSAGRFQSGLADFRSAATRTMGSAPGSSSGAGGGGSVGGGGGGGGGGSW